MMAESGPREGLHFILKAPARHYRESTGATETGSAPMRGIPV